jgi:hypothetical protein
MEATVRVPAVVAFALTALLALIAVSACSGQQPSLAAASPSSTLVASAGPTPTPTPASTPGPTATLTPTPTPEPTPDAELVQWQLFQRHAQRADERLTSLLTAFAELRPSDFDGQAAMARKMRAWSRSEKTWLRSHPALPCYRPTFLSYSRGVQAYDKAAVAFIDAYRSLRVSKLDEGYDAMDAAEGHLTKAIASHPASEAACRA